MTVLYLILITDEGYENRNGAAEVGRNSSHSQSCNTNVNSASTHLRMVIKLSLKNCVTLVSPLLFAVKGK